MQSRSSGRREALYQMLVTLITLGVALVAVVARGAGLVSGGDEELPHVYVELSGDLAEVEGIEWPTDSDGDLMEVHFGQEPVRLTLLLPTGQVFATATKSLYVRQTDQIVSVVTITPAPKLLSYSDAVLLASSVCEDLGLESDEEVQKRLRLWRANPETILLNETSDGVVTAPRITKSLGAELDADTSFFLEIKTHINGEGWYVVVEFASIKMLQG